MRVATSLSLRPHRPHRAHCPHRARLAAILLIPALLLPTACTDPELRGEPTPSPTESPSPSEDPPVTLEFEVYGPDALAEAWRGVADAFSDQDPRVTVRVEHVPDRAAYEIAESVTGGADGESPPDLFLADRQDLPELLAADALQPVDNLLSSRQVNFGDGYYRDAVLAFSEDARLQCMPVDVSPLVVYLNRDLVNLGRADVEVDEDEPFPMWSWDEFSAAARQVRGPRVSGVHVPPDLRSFAALIWSEGGDIVDDQEEPTTLTLADDSDAVGEVLTLLRDPDVTPSLRELRASSALDRFAAGRLGMLVADRSIVPRLRGLTDLNWDILPLPRLSGRSSSIDVLGACISSSTPDYSEAADFLAYAVSDDGASLLASTGYVMPANANVAHGPAFLQAGQRPRSALVYDYSVTASRLFPLVPRWTALQGNLAPLFSAMVYDPVIDLDGLLEAIDERSRQFIEDNALESVPST